MVKLIKWDLTDFLVSFIIEHKCLANHFVLMIEFFYTGSVTSFFFSFTETLLS